MSSQMVEHNVVPGTPEWLDLRRSYFTASEAPIMMGESPYKTRDELLKMKFLGVSDEVSPVLQEIYDQGHAAEAAARPFASKIAGEELFTKTGTTMIQGMPLLASFDGLDMMDSVSFEHKLYKKSIVQQIFDGELSLLFRIQLEQQLMVSGAEKSIFMTSDGTSDNMDFMWYKPDLALRDKIIAGWKQFAIDLDSYELIEEKIIPIAEPVAELRSLQIEVSGSVKSTNLAVYRKDAFEFITKINTTLVTDEDFVQAGENIKALKKVEAHIKYVKKATIDQTVEISEQFNGMDELGAKVREVRLKLENLEKTEKTNRKCAILQQAKKDYVDYRAKVVKDIMSGREYLPEIEVKFAEVIKGKKTLKSLQSVCNDELARLKIEVDANAEIIGVNLAAIRGRANDFKFLFHDIKDIINKEPDDFILLVDSRITTHKTGESEKLDVQREEIREEERQKLESQLLPETSGPEVLESKKNWGSWANGGEDRNAVAPSESEVPPAIEDADNSQFIAKLESATKDEAMCALREIAAPMSEKKAALIIEAIISGKIDGVYSNIENG